MPAEYIYFSILVILSILIPFSLHLLIVRVFGLYREKALRQKGAIVSGAWGFLLLGILFHGKGRSEGLRPGAGDPGEPPPAPLFFFRG